MLSGSNQPIYPFLKEEVKWDSGVFAAVGERDSLCVYVSAHALQMMLPASQAPKVVARNCGSLHSSELVSFEHKCTCM